MKTIRAKSDIQLRDGRPEDSERLGRICYEAFRRISEAHNFPPDFPSPDAAVGLMSMLLSRPDVYSVIAEAEGGVLGSNFLWEGNEVSGVGPITIDPASQNSSVGRRLMEAVIERSESEEFPSVRLVQAAYHNRSLSLYTKLGFDTVEPLSMIQGPPIRAEIDGYLVRPMTKADINESNALSRKIHGHTREGDLRDGIAQGTAKVVEHEGRLTGYTTNVGFFGHTVGESNEELKALIGSAESYAGPGFLLPTRNGELLRWCLADGLKLVQPMTLMSRGLYQEPRGKFLPSILF